ncbi:hypothetical protein DTO021C3_184 [Paecilomyces variotii]|nr:hypothetical protein DTO021C3_184 [Paecilomyces variotii]KAJ9372161.1 hypothetical protein DTO282E5_3254 [Paecilomyces variotii]
MGSLDPGSYSSTSLDRSEASAPRDDPSGDGRNEAVLEELPTKPTDTNSVSLKSFDAVPHHPILLPTQEKRWRPDGALPAVRLLFFALRLLGPCFLPPPNGREMRSSSVWLWMGPDRVSRIPMESMDEQTWDLVQRCAHRAAPIWPSPPSSWAKFDANIFTEEASDFWKSQLFLFRRHPLWLRLGSSYLQLFPFFVFLSELLLSRLCLLVSTCGQFDHDIYPHSLSLLRAKQAKHLFSHIEKIACPSTVDLASSTSNNIRSSGFYFFVEVLWQLRVVARFCLGKPLCLSVDTVAYSKTQGVLFDPEFQTPLVIDESLDFSDPEESRFAGAFSDGLLAKSEPVLPMSAFQRPSDAGLVDYDGSVYPAYSQGQYVNELFPSSSDDHASQNTESLHYMTEHDYAGRISFDGSGSPGLDRATLQIPEVTSYSPQRGGEGTKVFVQIQSPYDLHNRLCATYVIFGSKKCECLPHFLGFSNSVFQYALSVDAPAFALSGSPSAAVPLQVVIENQPGYSPLTLQVGVYTYETVDHDSPSDDSRKRRVSISDNAAPRPTKRPSAQQLRIKEDADAYSYNDSASSPSYSSFLQTPTTMSVFPAPYRTASSPKASFIHHSRGSSAPQPAIHTPSPLTSSWSPSFGMVSHVSRSPHLAAASAPSQKTMLSPARPQNPTLIRTSTIQQGSGSVGPPAFNPYAMYPSKAVLKLNGDLDSMAENWTGEEKEAKRRLVQFTRMQSGSTIQADFQPVSPEDRTPNSICISCIYWDGKKECFVTSVDTIYLLESLVGVRFTVEEKNRIRRNLEGFRPLTVSKAKPDSEDFFKVIMGFPAPKPRNIEKDVKVFPWKILSHALKKIIGKYSASYSSTAGALPTPICSSYPGNSSASDSGTDVQHAGSPQSVSDSVTSSTYSTGMTSAVFSPHIHQAKPSLSAPDLRVTMSPSSHPYAAMSASYTYQHGHGMPLAPMNRTSWDFPGAIGPGPAAANVSNTELYTYITPPSYPMAHSAPGA